eukprot:scaffold1102_cov256-Pinguiococcus_pyrenoidosus.AAC.14
MSATRRSSPALTIMDKSSVVVKDIVDLNTPTTGTPSVTVAPWKLRSRVKVSTPLVVTVYFSPWIHTLSPETIPTLACGSTRYTMAAVATTLGVDVFRCAVASRDSTPGSWRWLLGAVGIVAVYWPVASVKAEEKVRTLTSRMVIEACAKKSACSPALAGRYCTDVMVL